MLKKSIERKGGFCVFSGGYTWHGAQKGGEHSWVGFLGVIAP